MINDKTKTAVRMGKEIQVIREALLEYLTDPEYQTVTSKAETLHLSKALDRIESYRSETEDRCFNRGYIDDINIFYGLDVSKEVL